MPYDDLESKIGRWMEEIRAAIEEFYAHRGMRCHDCKTMRPATPTSIGSVEELPKGGLRWMVKSWKVESLRDGWVDVDMAGKRSSFCPACATARNLVLPDMGD